MTVKLLFLRNVSTYRCEICMRIHADLINYILSVLSFVLLTLDCKLASFYHLFMKHNTFECWCSLFMPRNLLIMMKFGIVHSLTSNLSLIIEGGVDMRASKLENLVNVAFLGVLPGMGDSTYQSS